MDSHPARLLEQLMIGDLDANGIRAGESLFEALKTQIKETTEKVEQIQKMLRAAAAKAEEQEHSVVFYRELGGKGDLKAYYTTDWQLQLPEP